MNNTRLGFHRCRPARSAASRAKPEIKRLERAIAEARGRGDHAATQKLTKEHAWLVINTLG